MDMNVIRSSPILIVRVNDWAALYNENECVLQEHHIGLYDLKKFLDGFFISLDMIDEVWLDGTAVEEWALNGGRLPEYRSEILEILSGKE